VLRNLTHIYHAIILFYFFLYTKLSLLNCDICHIFLFTISQIIPFYAILCTKFLNGSIFRIPPKQSTLSHSFLSHFIYKAIIPFYVFQRTNIPFIYKSTICILNYSILFKIWKYGKSHLIFICNFIRIYAILCTKVYGLSHFIYIVSHFMYIFS
jgi:hypothetical protein